MLAYVHRLVIWFTSTCLGVIARLCCMKQHPTYYSLDAGRKSRCLPTNMPLDMLVYPLLRARHVLLQEHDTVDILMQDTQPLPDDVLLRAQHASLPQ